MRQIEKRRNRGKDKIDQTRKCLAELVDRDG